MAARCQEDLIYDVGLHKGEDAEFYLKKGFRVVAIEALASHVQSASQRLRHYLESGQLMILNVAIAEKTGPVTFFESLDCSLWGTTYPERLRKDTRATLRAVERTVPGMGFAEILEQYGIPYFLKIDIEGAETLCLTALEGIQARPKFLSCECPLSSVKAMEEGFQLLRSLGYSKFKVVRQDVVSGQRCPFPAREGRFMDHHFEEEASGLFGEEAPGNWNNEVETMKLCRNLCRRFQWIEILSRLHIRRLLRGVVKDLGWYDLHAKLS